MMVFEKLNDSLGATCELRSLKNDLIFVGKILDFDGTTLTIAEAADNYVPPVIYNTEVKLNLYIPGGETLVIRGRVHGNGKLIWKVGDIIDLKQEEKREFFRQKVMCEGVSLCMNSVYAPFYSNRKKACPAANCQLVDVSQGGVLFRCNEQYKCGDWVVLLNISLVDDEFPFSFLCRINRVEESEQMGYNYGCWFVNQSEGERDRLCRSIFALQRIELQKHRNKGR